jgi:thermitase
MPHCVSLSQQLLEYAARHGMLPGTQRRSIIVVTIGISALFFLFLLTGIIAGTQPVSAQDAQAESYLIQFQPGTSQAERDAWLAQSGAELVSWMPQIGVAEVRFTHGAPLVAASDAASGDAGPIAFMEPDVPVSGDATISDPAYLDATQGYGQHLLDIASAWNVTKGITDTIIAIVDSGINLNHPEFGGRLVPGYDFINSDDDPSDDHGHGTHVAGIAAAGINGIGMVGVCPECKVMPVKVLNQRNGGTWGTVSKGILFAVDNGADVINLSLGASITSTTLISSVQYALDKGVVIVAAAGNMASSSPFYPAAVPGVIGVSGTDSQDQYWQVSDYGDYIDVSAPAVNIYSSYHDLANTSGYAYMSGTSMASPFVSGLVGLILSRRPDYTVDQVTNLLEKTARDLGDPGRDPLYGFGRVDAHQALVAANDGIDPALQNPANGGGTRPPAVYLPAVYSHR